MDLPADPDRLPQSAAMIVLERGERLAATLEAIETMTHRTSKAVGQAFRDSAGAALDRPHATVAELAPSGPDQWRLRRGHPAPVASQDHDRPELSNQP